MTTERKTGKPKVLVLGANGMLGHVALARLSGRFDVQGVVRSPAERWSGHVYAGSLPLIGGFDAGDPAAIGPMLEESRPDVVLNCIGIIKQADEVSDAAQTIAVNSLFPHLLAAACARRGIRVIQLSTDCVFSGASGPYSEQDPPDPVDLYGRSKLLGEADAENTLVLRTSIIGHELETRRGLLEWFLSNRFGKVSGFSGALYSGMTTLAAVDVLAQVIDGYPHLSGLWHVAGPAIDKYSLLCLFNEIYGAGVEIARDERFKCDRRLNGAAFAERTGIEIPSWPEMLRELYEDHRSDSGYRRMARG